jgi:hypothetical protein
MAVNSYEAAKNLGLGAGYQVGIMAKRPNLQRGPSAPVLRAPTFKVPNLAVKLPSANLPSVQFANKFDPKVRTMYQDDYDAAMAAKAAEEAKAAEAAKIAEKTKVEEAAKIAGSVVNPITPPGIPSIPGSNSASPIFATSPVPTKGPTAPASSKLLSGYSDDEIKMLKKLLESYRKNPNSFANLI